jgi:hypothetical protein
MCFINLAENRKAVQSSILARYMEEEDRKKIEEIIGQLSCPKNFKCAASGFEYLCTAKDVGIDTYLLCQDHTSFWCRFSIEVNHEYFCSCPLRVYLAKHLGK